MYESFSDKIPTQSHATSRGFRSRGTKSYVKQSNLGDTTNNNRDSTKPQARNDSLSNKFAKWTKKVSGITCGAADTLSITESSPDSTNNKVASKSEEAQVVAKAKRSYPPMPDKGRRHHYRSKGNTEDIEHDHHTLATATTGSATASYSTDQGDTTSVASEVGMEVVMSANSNHGFIEPTSATTSSMEDVVTFPEPYRPHSFQAGKHTFSVDQRYNMIRTVGSGAYGVVISATDSVGKADVAIKMVPKAFSDEIDAKRILREIKLLKHFNHENIIRIVDMMPPNVQYLEDFNDVYIVADLMETDLHRIIYSKQSLSIDHVQYFIYQVLRGLKYIHSCKVLHRDLKPSNLLVNSNCDLKICDFGLARGISEVDGMGRSGTMLLTEYVVTRWYRAPEIMLACHEYSYPIDVWSVGCIFAELLLRKPFFPGEDYIDQVCLNFGPVLLFRHE